MFTTHRFNRHWVGWGVRVAPDDKRLMLNCRLGKLLPMNDKKRRAILHIGHEKTGSTSLQHALQADSKNFQSDGFLLPRSPGLPNHTQLVAACLNQGVVDNIKAHQMAHHGLTEQDLQRSFFSKFSRELERNKDWHTLIITSELISSRLYDSREVERLLSLLRHHVDAIEIVLFIRRQDRLALSRFTSVLRAGYDHFDNPFIDASGLAFKSGREGGSAADVLQYFDYDKILSRFESHEEITIHLYVCDNPDDSLDSVHTFYNLLGITHRRTSTDQLRLNRSMSAQAQYVVSELNKKYRIQFRSGLRNEPYRRILQDVEANVTGNIRTVPATEAEEFYAQFEASNSRVRERYFPARDQLFDQDFADYPDTINYHDMKETMRRTFEHYDSIAAQIPQSERINTMLKRKFRTMSNTLVRKL